MYEIELKDGTVIPGVPDDMDPKAVAQDYYKNKEANKTEEGFGTFMAGVGRGAVNVGRNLSNLVGGVSDEELEESERLDRPLMETGSGLGGSIVGEIAATGGPAMAAVRGGLGRTLAKSIAANPIKSVVSGGAAAGYLGSDPSNRGISTGMGALGGAGGHALGKAVQKFGKGINQREGVAEFMEATGEDYLPISITAPDTSIAQRIYRDVAPSLPGGGKLIEENKSAFTRWRNKQFEEIIPEGSDLKPEHLVDDAATNMGMINRAWDDAYKDLGGVEKLGDKEFPRYIVNLKDQPKLTAALFGDEAVKDPTMKALSGRVFGRVEKTVGKGKKKKKVATTQGEMSMDDVMLVREHMLSKAFGEGKVTAGFRSGRIAGIMDEVAETMPDEWQRKWADIKIREPGYKAIRDAAKSAAESGGRAASDFLPAGQAAAASKRSPVGIGAAGEGVMQKEGADAAIMLGKELEVPSIWRWIATVSLVGTGALGGGPVGAAATLGIGRGLVALIGSKGFQKALMGHAPSQKAVAKMIKDNPELALQLQTALVNAGAHTGAETGR